MQPHRSNLLVLSVIIASACGAPATPCPVAPTVPAPQHAATAGAPLRPGLNIKLASLYVDDQDKALRFYTDVLGLAKKADVHAGSFRWLTVASPEDANGSELQLALDDNPAAKAYQQAMFSQGQPATMLFTDDLAHDYERIKARGAVFTLPPTAVTGSIIAMLNDTCGNLVQLTQLTH